MPRKSKIDAAGAIHHVIARGINRADIFSDDEDYKSFLNRLEAVLTGTKTACYAWALMPNHFHLLLRTGTTPVSTVMRRLLTGYAVNYNRRHRRFGHLFQNSYKSILCQEDLYLKELVRYIHLNPLCVYKNYCQSARDTARNDNENDCIEDDRRLCLNKPSRTLTTSSIKMPAAQANWIMWNRPHGFFF